MLWLPERMRSGRGLILFFFLYPPISRARARGFHYSNSLWNAVYLSSSSFYNVCVCVYREFFSGHKKRPHATRERSARHLSLHCQLMVIYSFFLFLFKEENHLNVVWSLTLLNTHRALIPQEKGKRKENGLLFLLLCYLREWETRRNAHYTPTRR